MEFFPRKRSSSDWQAIFKEVEVLDPDGWDRQNFLQSWYEPITEQEYKRRRTESTCQWHVPMTTPNV